MCEILWQLGATVYGTVRPHISPLSAYNIFKIEQKIIPVNVDISDRQQVFDLINSLAPDIIFHLAAKVIVPVVLRDPRRAFEVNTMGTVNIIEACRQLKLCRKLIIISTDHVFGHVEKENLPKKGFSEDSLVNYGGDPYAASKAAMELMVRSYYTTYGSELPAIAITRCPNVFGYGDANQRRIIPEFIRKAITQKKIEPRYILTRRQYIHITDVTAGYILVASTLDEDPEGQNVEKKASTSRTSFTPTFHFAIETYEPQYEDYLAEFTNNQEKSSPNVPYLSVGALAYLIGDICNQKTHQYSSYKQYVDYSNSRDYSPRENKAQALNCSITRTLLEWEPKKSLRDGLSELYQWYEIVKERESVSESELKNLKSLIDQNIGEIFQAVRASNS